MEVVSYQKPRSWSDKGMTWDATMNSVCVDYAAAIREAIYERCAAAGVSCRNLSIDQYAPIEYDFFVNVRNILKSLAPKFYDLEYEEYKEDFSDFPKKWSWRDLNIIEECRICEIPSVGCAVPEIISWMIRAMNYLNKLTVISCSVKGKLTSGYGSVHDPPFSESINTALREAREDAEEYDFQGDSSRIYAWSGNTHYKRNPNGYCGYAQFQNIKVENVIAYANMNGDLIVAGHSYMDETPLSYSSILQSYVYDSAGTVFREDDFSFANYGYAERYDVLVGCNAKSIPKNAAVPSSTFEPKTIRRSTKRGFWAKVFFLIDYGIEGGFKFRA